jgi:hypothetical protein
MPSQRRLRATGRAVCASGPCAMPSYGARWAESGPARTTPPWSCSACCRRTSSTDSAGTSRERLRLAIVIVDREDLPPPPAPGSPRPHDPHRVRDTDLDRSRGLTAPTNFGQLKSGQSRAAASDRLLSPAAWPLRTGGRPRRCSAVAGSDCRLFQPEIPGDRTTSPRGSVQPASRRDSLHWNWKSSPSQRAMRPLMAAHHLHAGIADPAAYTAPARAASLPVRA